MIWNVIESSGWLVFIMYILYDFGILFGDSEGCVLMVFYVIMILEIIGDWLGCVDEVECVE